MRITAHKKKILSIFEPDKLEWLTSEVGPPPIDVIGVAYLLHGTSSHDKRHQIESTRRTLEAMVKDGLLEKVAVYERRQNRMQDGGDAPGVRCMVSRYGLPGTVTVVRDEEGAEGAIEGEFAHIP